MNFGSSNGCAISDDALKDADNAAWLVYLIPDAQAEWRDRIYWIRTIDRLAEQGWLNGERTGFEQFCQHWQHWCDTKERASDTSGQLELWRKSRTWRYLVGNAHSNCDPHHLFALSAWQHYLRAVATYHRDDLVLQTLTDYDRMIERLGGSLFQVLPDLDPDLACGARAMGSLDQCYNHLRDLNEDSQHRLCYFPHTVLAQFGLNAEHFYQRTVFEQPGYRQLMHYWLHEYLPPRKIIARQFAQRLDLPPSWKLLCDWSFDRYQRIEACLQHYDYNYTDFAQHYWADVRQHLKYHPKTSSPSIKIQTPIDCAIHPSFKIHRSA
jgi:phytoene synthase